jgi:hypothetical protein
MSEHDEMMVEAVERFLAAEVMPQLQRMLIARKLIERNPV